MWASNTTVSGRAASVGTGAPARARWIADITCARGRDGGAGGGGGAAGILAIVPRNASRQAAFAGAPSNPGMDGPMFTYEL